jgi:hypothetical protein
LILQPGPSDGGRPDDAVALLLAAETPRGDRSTLLDAAIASLMPGIGFDQRTLLGLRAEPLEPGDIVTKPDACRTTGF